MANTRKAVIDALVEGLNGLAGIRTATNKLLAPSQAREAAPYIGIIAAGEDVLVEDEIAIRYGITVDFVLLAPDDDYEELLDKVKTYVYSDPAIGALQIKIIGEEEASMVNEDKYSSVRIMAYVTYVSTKGAF